MNKLESLFRDSKGVEQYARGYFKYLGELLSRLDTGAIAALVAELEQAYAKQNNIFIVGNGGSAATASHMANDIGVDVYKKSKCERAFRALALTDNCSVMTAIANDDGYDNLFVNQLLIHYRSGDKLIAISASGNSPNVVKAAQWVKSQGGKVVGLLGFDGGQLKAICDIVILATTEKGEYGPVEDIHLIIDHLVGSWLQYKMTAKVK
jgi:D-sedoheptulose 7-phosphate isomerase